MNPPQHMQALALANERKQERCQITHALKRGELMFADLDLTAPCLKTMRVLDLLRSLPWSASAKPDSAFRKGAVVKPNRVLREAGIPPTFTVGKLTERQQAVLRVLVEKNCPTQRREAVAA